MLVCPAMGDIGPDRSHWRNGRRIQPRPHVAMNPAPAAAFLGVAGAVPRYILRQASGNIDPTTNAALWDTEVFHRVPHVLSGLPRGRSPLAHRQAERELDIEGLYYLLPMKRPFSYVDLSISGSIHNRARSRRPRILSALPWRAA
jgi:hypothetical protein